VPRVLLGLVVGAALGGCDFPSRVPTPVEFDFQRVSHVGDAFKILPVKGQPEGPIEVTITNQGNGSTKTLSLAASGGTITLDSAGLPGFQEDAKVQNFEVWAAVQGHRVGNDVSVVKDPAAQPFPIIGVGRSCPAVPNGPLAVPPGPMCWTAGDSLTGAETYVNGLVTTWKLESPTITHRAVAWQDVKRPPYMQDVPDTTKLVRYDVAAAFPTYFVPAEYSASGKDDVYAPTSLAIVLTQTDPAMLVSLTAL
jgi:hypothetical protein